MNEYEYDPVEATRTVVRDAVRYANDLDVDLPTMLSVPTRAVRGTLDVVDLLREPISCGDRVATKDGDVGTVQRIESEVVGYGEHGRPIVETAIRVRVDCSSIVPAFSWVDPTEIEVVR